MQKINYNIQILITLAILIVVTVFFEYSNVDILIQSHFYDFSSSKWLIDRNNSLLKLIFYDGIKKIIVAVFISILLSLLFFRKRELVQKYQKGLFIVLLAGILIPSTVGLLKKFTKVPCPRNISIFNAEHPYIKVFQKYPENFHIKKRIKCWPAGHVSGGFALLSLFFLFKNMRNRILSLIAVISVSWLMGTYKMLIGDHFISHTIITMIISWLIILIIVNLSEKISSFKRR